VKEMEAAEWSRDRVEIYSLASFRDLRLPRTSRRVNKLTAHETWNDV
jgi:hypothetical protein